MAFTRNPSDLTVSPATYKADGSSDLIIGDQPTNIQIDGSEEKDTIEISTRGLAASSLTNYSVRAFDGKDIVTVTSNVVTNSEINGNKGDDSMFLNEASLQNSYLLGGAGNDTITITNVGTGEVNGNKGNDTINVFGGTNTIGAQIRGGQDNDTINVYGDVVDSTFYGDLGNDLLAIEDGFYGTSSAFGGDGIDTITHTAFVGSLVMDGGAGNDRITGSSTLGNTYIGGEGNDIITAGAIDATETSTFDGGVGGDTITGANNGGVNTYIFDAGDGVAANSGGYPAKTGANGAVITWDGNSGAPDVINGFSTANDKIDGDVTGSPTQVNSGGAGGGNPLTLATDEIYLLIGNYNAGNTTFTADLANGKDAIVLMGGDGLNTANIFTTSDDMFIMTGVGRGLTAANFV